MLSTGELTINVQSVVKILLTLRMAIIADAIYDFKRILLMDALQGSFLLLHNYSLKTTVIRQPQGTFRPSTPPHTHTHSPHTPAKIFQLNGIIRRGL